MLKFNLWSLQLKFVKYLYMFIVSVYSLLDYSIEIIEVISLKVNYEIDSLFNFIQIDYKNVCK